MRMCKINFHSKNQAAFRYGCFAVVSFYNSCYDVALGKVDYKASFKNGKSVSGIIHNDADFRILYSDTEDADIIPIDSDYENIQFNYSGGYLDLFKILSTATHYKKKDNFNTAKFNRFELRENGILTDHLTKGKSNTISLSTYDGSFELYIKLIQDTIWKKVPLKLDATDNLWKGTLSNNLAVGYYDAKIIVNAMYDSLIYTVKPAFVFKSDLCNTADTSMVHPVKIKSSSNNNIFCNTKTPITLTATGADFYTWSTNEDTPSIKVKTTGIFSVKGINLNGCSDTSSVYIHIQPVQSIQKVRICEGDSYNGHSTSGNYTDTLKTPTGCDSLKILNLTVDPPYLFNENYSICKGETYFWHGKSYSTSNTYFANYTSITGCDSSYTLNLIVNPNPPYKFNENYSICDGQTYFWQGQSYTKTNIYTANYKSISGCDSTYTLNLKVYPIFKSTETYSICKGETYHWHGKDYSIANTYKAQYTNTNGCDSIYTLILQVNSVDTVLVQNGNTLTVISIADSYQWVNCDKNFEPIAGEVNQSFTTSYNGNYAVIITHNHCIDTSACFQIIPTGITPVQKNTVTSIYPNPVSNELIIERKGNSKQEITFEIFNVMGQVIATGSFKNRVTLQTSKFTAGVYMIKLKDGDNYYFSKVVKE